MEEKTDYECYVLGCENARLEPLEEWRFRMLQEHSRRQASSHELWAQRSPVPEFVLQRLEMLVADGAKIAAGPGFDEDEPGAAACGVREPRVPSDPTLVGAASRPLPASDAPDLSYWRT